MAERARRERRFASEGHGRRRVLRRSKGLLRGNALDRGRARVQPGHQGRWPRAQEEHEPRRRERAADPEAGLLVSRRRDPCPD